MNVTVDLNPVVFVFALVFTAWVVWRATGNHEED